MTELGCLPDLDAVEALSAWAVRARRWERSSGDVVMTEDGAAPVR